MTKVLHLANTSFFIDRLLSDKLRALNTRGYYSVVAAPGADKQIEEFPAYHLDIARNISPIRDLRSLYRCAEIIRSSGCDIVHTHSAKAGMIGRTAAMLAGIPCVHTVHGLPFYPGQNKFSYTLYRAIERAGTAMSVCVLCQNHADAETLRKLCPRSPIRYEGNEVDFTRIQSYRNRRDHARARLGLWEKDVAIGFFARIEPVKRHDFFLQAFEQLPAHAITVFAGARMNEDNAYEKHILRRIRLSPASARCLELGFHRDPLSVLCACDIVALTSEKEGMPRILMEAMALGIPVCATAAPGTMELVRHEVTGLLSPVDDVGAFAENLAHLCADPLLRSRLGTNGSLYAAAELNTEAVINRIIHAYHLVENPQL